MRRKAVALFTSLLWMVMATFFFACKGKEDTVQPVAIDLTGVTVETGDTLLDIMTGMKAEGKLTFELSNGMITSINGVKNAATFNPCWMLYTSDDDPTVSNTTWGTFEYDGKTLGSAALGADSLFVKTGEVYVWVYQSF